MKVRRLGPDDASTAHRAVSRLKITDAALREALSLERLRSFLGFSGNVLIVATDDGVPVGFALAYLLDRVDRGPRMMLFYEVGVAESHRRRGIGRAMVHLLKEVCVAEGVFKMWVQTRWSNRAAMALYRSTGARPDAGDDEVSFRYDFAGERPQGGGGTVTGTGG